jgi:hypothetical protein
LPCGSPRALEDAHKKSVGTGPARRHQHALIDRKDGARESRGGVSQRRRDRRGNDRKAGLAGQERVDRFDQRDGAVEHLHLLDDALRERPRAHAPLGVRVAAPGPGSGAGRIDQDKIDAIAQIGERIVIRALGCADLDVARARALESRVDRCQAATVEVGCLDLAAVSHQGRERKGLAPVLIESPDSWRRALA